MFKSVTRGKLAFVALNIEKELDEALFNASDFNPKMIKEFEKKKGKNLEDVPLKVADALTNLEEFKNFKAAQSKLQQYVNLQNKMEADMLFQKKSLDAALKA